MDYKIDGRANNGGHSTKGVAGRKPKDQERKLIENLDSIINSEEAVQILRSQILEGNIRALQLYFNYRFGKPKQFMDVQANVLNLKFKELLKFE